MTHLLGNHRRNLNLAVTLKPVNYETDPRVNLRFEATNPESLKLTKAKMDIFVNNENDNSPIFRS